MLIIKKIETKSGCTKQFSLDTLQKICKALEINPKIFFEELEDKKILETEFFYLLLIQAL